MRSTTESLERRLAVSRESLRTPVADVARPRRWPVLLAALVIAGAGAAAYSNSFRCVFIFDDLPGICKNETLLRLWPIWPVLFSATAVTCVGRPLLNLSLAVNYALAGGYKDGVLEVWGFHLFDLVTHILTGLVLLGVVRRTLLLPSIPERFRKAATGLAMAIALIWTVHPLQTESVTYLVQRCEAMVGFFYLLTLYSIIRASQARRPVAWYVVAVVACVLGTATKEVMATAPVVLFVYDRVFLAGSFREALRRRWVLYAFLVATWGMLAVLVLSSEGRAGSAGFGYGMGSWEYGRTQFKYVVHYLRLAFWPNPLVLDYGVRTVDTVAEILPYAIVVTLLAAGTAVALLRRPWIGFLGFWFFAILAPSSSFVPLVTQIAAEHRMYLPLAAVVTLVVIGGYAGGTRLLARLEAPDSRRKAIGVALAVALVGAVAGVFGYLTYRRNMDYSSDLTAWSDIATKVPDNARAQYTVGNCLGRRDRLDEAIERYKIALRLDPAYVDAHNNLGGVYLRQKKLKEAEAEYREAIRIRPTYAEAISNLGGVLAMQGRREEAIACFRQALRIKPGCIEAQGNLSRLLAQMPPPPGPTP